MTQDEIIEMVKKAGWSGIYSTWTNPTTLISFRVPLNMQQLEAFAKLVAAKAFQNGYEKGIAGFNEAVSLEREACAKECEQEQEYWGWDKVIDAAKIIRARGEQA